MKIIIYLLVSISYFDSHMNYADVIMFRCLMIPKVNLGVFHDATCPVWGLGD